MTPLFLVDGDGGREAFDGIAICLFHLSNKLSGIGREALDIAALSFGVQRVKRKA